MLRIAPQRYLAEPKLLEAMGEHLEGLGERVLIIAGKTALERHEEVIREALKESMLGVSIEVCLGECCQTEVDRQIEKLKAERADIVMGLGGGTPMDVAKFVGERTGCAVVTVPTVTSSPAAFTNQVHLYTEDGDFVEQLSLDVCPNLLLLDHKAVGLASSRHLAAGIAGAYSVTKFVRSEDEPYGRQLARELSKSLRNFLYDEARGAVGDVKKGEVTEKLSSTVEAVILQSGLIITLAGEPTPGQISHYMAQKLLPYAEEPLLYGEGASFFTLVQERLFGTEEIEKTVKFFRDLQLPISLDGLGLPEHQRETIVKEAAKEIVDRFSESEVDLEVGEIIEAVQECNALGEELLEAI